MKERSPFAFGRFERAGRNAYFLHEEIYQEVIRDAPTPIYLIGPRGTGKTTLLKALHWRERLDNQSLRRALPADVFDSSAGHFLGVYLKLPETLLGVIEQWVADLPRELASLIVGLYLDLVWVETVCTAIAELLAEEVLVASPEKERVAIRSLTQRYGATFTRRGTTVPQTVVELGMSVLRLRLEIEQCAKLRRPHAEILEYDIVGQVGSFGKAAGEVLEPLCRTAEDQGPWHFRICMDEGESLSHFQLLVLNSMVRVAKAPVVYIVSFVSMPTEVNETLYNNLTLQATDREIVSFDELVTNKRFREFVEGVVTVRIRESLPDATFRAGQTLGRLDVNELLRRILSDSVSPYAKALEARAEALHKHPLFSSQGGATAGGEVDEDSAAGNDEDDIEVPEDTGSSNGGAPPIYQAFLLQELNLALPLEEVNWKRRRQSSAELRKRMVAAYLTICHRLGTEPRYASAQMVLGLSDLCIRDFLRFLDRIYQQSGAELAEFVNGPITFTVQDYAVKEASTGKGRGIDESGVSSPREIEMIVRGLGRITKILQTRGSQRQHLLSSERGIFRLPLAALTDEREKGIYQQIREAAEAGFLRITKHSRDNIEFRLHASLAPVYGLSYRGAYYHVRAEWADLELLGYAKSDAEVNSLADRIGSRLAGDEELSLFPE